MSNFVTRSAEPFNVEPMSLVVPASVMGVKPTGSPALLTGIGLRDQSELQAPHDRLPSAGVERLVLADSLSVPPLRQPSVGVGQFFLSAALLRLTVSVGLTVARITFLRERTGVRAALGSLAFLGLSVLAIDRRAVRLPLVGTQSVAQCGHGSLSHIGVVR